MACGSGPNRPWLCFSTSWASSRPAGPVATAGRPSWPGVGPGTPCCYHLCRPGVPAGLGGPRTRRQAMAEQRSTIEFTVDGLSIAALTAGPAAPAAGRGRPLIAALHGGTYTARYFDVAGSPRGTFMDLAATAGYQVVSF